MYIEEDEYYYVDKFNKEGVMAIYTKKTCGDFSDNSLINKENNHISKFLSKFKKEYKIIYAKQTHSNNIKIIDDKIEKNYDDVDGFITKRKDIILLTKYADCLPLYFYDKKNSVIGVAHSGWGGTYKEIYKEILVKLEENYNSKKEDIIVAIGIGIKNCCYEIGEEFYEKFISKFSNEIMDKVILRKNGKLYYDNELLNYELIKEIGIPKENITMSNKCTYCSDEFFSYRKGDKSERNSGIIFFK
ncbi:MAG: peptidoglycan editing factor PgeF [Fusobacteria bacterium]|nr:peptidoglycan editing factor PgeF [Fusobacteriota bacterium]